MEEREFSDIVTRAHNVSEYANSIIKGVELSDAISKIVSLETNIMHMYEKLPLIQSLKGSLKEHQQMINTLAKKYGTEVKPSTK